MIHHKKRKKKKIHKNIVLVLVLTTSHRTVMQHFIKSPHKYILKRGTGSERLFHKAANKYLFPKFRGSNEHLQFYI